MAFQLAQPGAGLSCQSPGYPNRITPRAPERVFVYIYISININIIIIITICRFLLPGFWTWKCTYTKIHMHICIDARYIIKQTQKC